MPDENPKKLIDIHAAHGVFPLTQLLESGLWKALTANAKAVLGPLWNFHRQYPDACRPSRQTLAAEAGVCGPSVTKAPEVGGGGDRDGDLRPRPDDEHLPAPVGEPEGSAGADPTPGQEDQAPLPDAEDPQGPRDP